MNEINYVTAAVIYCGVVM